MARMRQTRQGQSADVSQRMEGTAVGRAGMMTPAQRRVMQMQQSLGNRAMGHLLAQMKQGDAVQRMELPEEEELQMKADETVQRMELPEDEEELQMKADETAQRMEMPEEEELQMKAAEPPVQRKGKMPEDVQAKMESAMGADFSDVNIHEGNKASEVGALAYTQGNDIHFAQGKFDPHSKSGQELLGHELAHVVQQRAGRVQPTTEVGGLPVNDDASLEQEADNLGMKAAALEVPEAVQGKGMRKR